MSAAALILQLLQTWKAFSPPSSNIGALSVRNSNLQHLEDSISKTRSDIRRIHRAIDQGSKDSDREYYNAPYRIAISSLELDRNSHQLIQQSLATAISNLGNLSQWINHFIREDPEMAARLGSRIAGALEATADVLNNVMSDGGPNRIVVQEARLALEELSKAIETEIEGSRN